MHVAWLLIMDDQFPPVTRREMMALTGTSSLAGCLSMNLGTQHIHWNTTQQENQNTETVRAFVGSYHWGFFILDEDGTELDQVTLSPGDELRLTLFNVEADAAVEALPQAVRKNIPSPSEQSQRNEQSIPVPQRTTLETLQDAAKAAYPDHGLVITSDEYLGNRPDGPGPGPGNGGPSSSWGGPYRGRYGPGQGDQGPRQGPQGPPRTEMMPGYGPGMQSHRWWSRYGRALAPPVYLWYRATVPSELGFVVGSSGSFGFACTVYCGYGHPYMVERSRVIVAEN